MQRITRSALILALAGLLTACGGPELDGKTQETLQLSMKEVIESLDKDEARQFQKDIATIGMHAMAGMKLDLKDIEAKNTQLLDTLDGKNASEIADLANEIREQADAKKLADEEARKARGPVIDGQSERTLDKSVKAMAENLSKDEQKVLMESIMTIARDAKKHHRASAFADEKAMQELLSTLNDKSFDEVLELAEEIRAKQS